MDKKKLSALLRFGGTALSLGLFAWLLTRQNWGQVLASLGQVNPWFIGLALLVQISAYGFNNLRWCILLWAQKARVSFWQTWRINWAGMFASQFLPSTIGGDGFRMLAIYPHVGSKSIAIGSVALDRLINMTAMACLLPLPLGVFGTQVFSQLMLVLPASLQKLAERYFPKIAEAARAWAAHPGAFAWAFLAAWPSNLLPMTMNYIVASQLGMNVSFWQVMAVQTVSYFMSALPISFNGLGVREVVFTTLYSALGATIEQAATLALLTRFLMLFATLPGALWLSRSVTDTVPLE